MLMTALSSAVLLISPPWQWWPWVRCPGALEDGASRSRCCSPRCLKQWSILESNRGRSVGIPGRDLVTEQIVIRLGRYLQTEWHAIVAAPCGHVHNWHPIQKIEQRG